MAPVLARGGSPYYPRTAHLPPQKSEFPIPRMSDTPETDQSTRPEISEIRKAQTWFLGIIAFAVILFLLVQAKFLLISLAIAIMLFSLTSDAINYFQRMRIGSARVSIWIASVLAVLLIATILISASLIIIAQATRSWSPSCNTPTPLNRRSRTWWAGWARTWKQPCWTG